MIWKETKSFSLEQLKDLRDEFGQILKKKYPALVVNVAGAEKECFKLPDGDIIYPSFMFGGTDNAFHCLVVEYAGTPEEIQDYLEEEGGQFFPEDYESKEKMFQAMLAEIES